MEDMYAWGFASCSVVPVGLTKYREGLSKLRPVDRETANADIVSHKEAQPGVVVFKIEGIPAAGGHLVHKAKQAVNNLQYTQIKERTDRLQEAPWAIQSNSLTAVLVLGL